MNGSTRKDLRRDALVDVRSALAAKTAQDMGLTPVCHLQGGFGAWKKAGAPVERVEPKW